MRANENIPATSTDRRSVMSLRVIVTIVTTLLIGAAVFGVGNVAERNNRRVLTRELETRLILEARNLAFLSSGALLSDFPELTLYPVVKDMRTERPDLAMVYVVDHHNIVQGHADAERIGTEFELDLTLDNVPSDVTLGEDESLMGNDDVFVVKTPILHPNGERIGTAIVGLEKSHVEALLIEARKKQGVFLLLILGAALLLTPVLMSALLRPIGIIRNGLEKIGHGDLDTRLSLSSMTELGVLAGSINNMASKLKSAQVDLVEKERLDHEMQLARQIQQSLIPGDQKRAGKFVISGAQTAAEEVGGDYFDVFPLGDGRTGIVVADVSGKGLAGCMITSMIAVLIRTLRASHGSPAKLLVALQESLIDSLQPGMFVTMFYGILDSESGELTYASAAHNPLLHYSAATKTTQWHKTKGIPLGLIRGVPLQESLEDATLVVRAGDLLLQYTDGFSEAMSESGEQYGLDRMAELVQGCADGGGSAVISKLQADVENWEKPLPAHDDKTLLVIDYPVGKQASEVPKVSSTVPVGSRTQLVEQLWKKRSKQFFSMPATLEALDDVGQWLKRCPYVDALAPEDFGLLEQGLYEICANIVEHGCRLDATKKIEIWYILDGPPSNGTKVDHALHARKQLSKGYFLVRDNGLAPDTSNWPKQELDGIKVRREGRGLGLRIIHETFQEVEFHPIPGVGNITILKLKTPEYQQT